MFSDLRFSLRTLRKNPGFTIAAILALAIGIGANSAMFSIIESVLLRPLPFPHSERMVNIWESNLKRNIPRMVVAPANYYDWRKQDQVFTALGAYQQNTFNLASSSNEPERFLGAICDPGFWRALQVAPELGRTFNEQEDQPGRDGVVILGHGLWRQRFGGDPKIIGQTFTLDGRPRMVIGVMPAGFHYPGDSVMWAPLAMQNDNRERRDFHQLRVIARLKDSVSLERARSSYETIGARLAHQYPDLNKDESIVVNPMLDDTVGPVRASLFVLMGAVVFVLLIACANVANLLLAKAAARRHEIAMRASLGAGRTRIVRQMLTESVLLSFSGGLVGLLLASFAFEGLLSLAPANVPRLNETTLNWDAVGFTLLLSIVTGILFGLAPAWQASRTDLHSLLKEASRSATTRSRLRDALVVAQMAATLILLAGAGLLMRSFYEISTLDAGFNAANVMSMRLAPARFKYMGHNDLQIELARGILRNVSALPGIRSVAISTDVPLLGNPFYIMRFEGRPPVAPSEAPVTGYFAVTSGFFETMGMHILRGRAFTTSDTADSPLAAIVNQTLVNRYFPNQDPIGKRLEIGFSTPPVWREIVGVVADVRTDGLDQDTLIQVYTDYLQKPSFIRGLTPAITVLARTTQDPALSGASMKAAILKVDRSQPVYSVQPMTAVVAQSIAPRRLSLIMLAFFALSALFLAALGLSGVMSYNVTQRTPEIGIRMALGARQRQVLFLVERQALKLVLIGLAIGTCGALALTRAMSSLLFHVNSADAPTFALAAVVLVVVSLLACYLPARRAAKVDPIIALRYE